MSKIKLVYQGRRTGAKNKVCHVYGIIDAPVPTDTLWFVRPLDRIVYRIGTAIECTRTEAGVEGPYKLDLNYRPAAADVREWSLYDHAAAEARDERVKAKKPISGDVKELVQQIRQLPRNERCHIVKYLITNLL